MDNETTLTLISPGTPPDFADGVVEIEGPYGIARITKARLAEIAFNTGQDKEYFDRLIREEVFKLN
jgi:hypothetical protein